MTALDKTWHTEHFFCAQCGKQFGEDGFHEKDGKPYCKDDYFDMFAPKCGGCNRPIMENYISALNTQWHPDCFVCRVSTMNSNLFSKHLFQHNMMFFQCVLITWIMILGLQESSIRQVLLCHRR